MDEFEQLIKTLQAALDKSTTGSQSRRDAVKRDLDNLVRSNALSTEELKNRNKALNAARDLIKSDEELKEKLDDRIKQNNEIIKTNEAYRETVQKVSSAFVGLGKAAFRGSGSISDFTDNVFGAQTVGRLLDTNIETFRQLSQVGATFGQSIVELRNAAGEAQLPLDDFTKLIQENSESLASLFGSTTKGSRAIASLSAEVRQFGIARLAPLGFTVDEINETLLTNLDRQRRFGLLDSLSRTQQRESAISFAQQLDRLTKLTGVQRDQLREAIESAKSNTRFQAFLGMQTDEAQKRIGAFAAVVRARFGPAAEGIEDLIARNGVAVTEAAREITQFTGGNIRTVIERLNNGSLSAEEALLSLKTIAGPAIANFENVATTGALGFVDNLFVTFQDIASAQFDVRKAIKEQEGGTTSLVASLTTFEQATKVLASQFQGIETGLLQAFGPQLGGIINRVQGLFGDAGAIATNLKESPNLTAGLIVGALTGKFLFDKAAQIAIIAAGVRLGSPGGLARLGGAAVRTGGGLGLAAGVGTVAGGTALAASGEKGLGIGTAAAGGALTGAQIGSLIAPGIGTAIGLVLGGLVGAGAGYIGSMAAPDGMQFGGIINPTRATLVGEDGPEIIRSTQRANVTSNNDLESMFNLEPLETKMGTLVSELNAANKTLNDMVNGVNTLVAVNSRALKANETTARKVSGQIGLV